MGLYVSAHDDDLEVIIGKMRSDIAVLMRRTRVPATSIDEGDFIINSGGNVILKNGGSLIVESGNISAHHADGSLGIYFGDVIAPYHWADPDFNNYRYGTGIQIASDNIEGNVPFFQAVQIDGYLGTHWTQIDLGTEEKHVYLLDSFTEHTHLRSDSEIWLIADGEARVECENTGYFWVHGGPGNNLNLISDGGIVALHGATWIDLLSDANISLRAANGISLDPGAGASGYVFISHTTTGAAANCYIGTTGAIYRSTSSRRYKQDIQPLPVNTEAFLGLQPKSWRDRNEVVEDPTTNNRYVGYIAEDLHDLGLNDFLTYDEEGPESISYDRLVVGAIEVLKEQNGRIKSLEAQVAELRGMVEGLTGTKEKS